MNRKTDLWVGLHFGCWGNCHYVILGCYIIEVSNFIFLVINCATACGTIDCMSKY